MCDFLVPSSHNLTFPTGFKVLSEAERTTALSSLLRHFTQVKIRFFIPVLQQMAMADSITLSEPGRRGSFVESDRNLVKSPRLKSNMPSSPFPVLQHQCHAPPVARIRLELFFLLSRFCQFRPQSKRRRGDLPSTARQNQYRQQRYPSHIGSGSHRGTWAGVSSLSQATERDNSPTRDISVEPRSFHPQSADFSGLSGGPALHAPCSDSGASTNYPPLWATAGRAW